MGVAALVIGIISLILGFIPFCGVIALIPAIVGAILGIVDWVKKSKAGEAKGMSVAGTILSIIAVIIIILWFVLPIGISILSSSGNATDKVSETARALEEAISEDEDYYSSYSTYY